MTPQDDEILQVISSILGDDPKPSILFGAPAVSLAQIEAILSLPAHTLDPDHITKIACALGETMFNRCMKPESRQLKRAGSFEDWLVFRPDPNGLKQTTENHSSKARSAWKDLVNGKKNASGLQVSTDTSPVNDLPKIDLPPPHRVVSKLWHDIPVIVSPVEPAKRGSEPQIASLPFPLSNPEPQIECRSTDFLQEGVNPSPAMSLPRPPPRTPRPGGATEAPEDFGKKFAGASPSPSPSASASTTNSSLSDVLDSSSETSASRESDDSRTEDETLHESEEESDLENNLPSPVTPVSPGPPTPFFAVALHDLPFAPDLSIFNVSECFQARWQLLAAQAVGLGAVIWILQSTHF